MRIFKRMMSLVLTLVMLAGMVPPVGVRAEEAETVMVTEEATEAASEATTEMTEAPEESTEQTEETEETTEATGETIEITEETTEATGEITEVTEETTEATEETAEATGETTEVTEETTEATEETAAETEPEQELKPEGYTPPWRPNFGHLTEETCTWTEDVTVMEPLEDGGYRMYETTQTFQDTFLVQELTDSGEAMRTEAASNADNTYRITTFDELEQLAAGTYDSYTVVNYCGGYPLTIARSVALPENLRLVLAGTDTAMVIPKNVVFANSYCDGYGGIWVEELTVAGTFYANCWVSVSEKLTVTGWMVVQGESLDVDGGAKVTGAENVTVTGNGWGPRRIYSNITTVAGLKSAVAAAKKDTTGWQYLIEICTTYGDVKLTENLTIPDNVQMNIYCNYDKNTCGSFIVPVGVRLTSNAFYSYFGAPIAVAGTWVNNCPQVAVWDRVSVTGSYAGTGVLRVMKEAFASWEEAVYISADSILVREAERWWIVRTAKEGRLGTPADVAWNKRVLMSEEVVDAKGHIYWKKVLPDEDQVVVRFYDADTDELVRTWNCQFGGRANARSVDAFITSDLDSGRYYFTVTSVSGPGSDYFESVPARSGVWNYIQTGTPMERCTDVKLSWPECSWTDPAAAGETTTHCIRIFYSETEDGTPRQIESNFGFVGNRTRINTGLYERYGKGYYSFQVRAIPDDISKHRVGEWSDMSEAYYYDPDTFAYDENWITGHIGKGPEGTGVEKFVFVDMPVTLRNDYATPDGLVLDIGRGGTVRVPAGKTLTLNCDQVSIYDGGRLIVEAGGRLIVNGNIMMYFPNGSLEVCGDAEFRNGAQVLLFHRNGMGMGNVTGVAPENRRLVVQVGGDPNTWELAFNVFENNDCGWKSLEIQGDVRLSRDLACPEKSGIYVMGNASLTVDPDVRVTLPRSAEITVNKNGSLYNNGELEIAGCLLVYGTANNNGSVTMMEGEIGQWSSKLMVYHGGVFRNYGTVTACPWSDVSAEGTWTGNAPDNRGGDVYGKALSMTQAKFEKGIAAAKKAGKTYILNQAVTITESMKLSCPVTVGNGGMITVKKGATLTVSKPLTLEAGADLQIQSGAKLKNYSEIRVCTTREAYGSLSVAGSYTHGENALLKVRMDGGTPSLSGVATEYQTAWYDRADEELLLEAMALEGYRFIEVWTDCLELNRDVTIPENAILIINPTWEDLEEGTRDDWVYLNGKVTVYGELKPNAYFNGTPCNLEINGTVDVMPGGKMNVCGNVVNAGYVHVAADGSYSFTNRYGACWEGDQPQIDLGQKDIRNMIKAGQKHITLNNPLVLTDDLTIPEGIYFRLYGSGALMVPAGVTLTLNNSMSIYGGTLTVEEGGTLKMNAYIDAYEGSTVDFCNGNVQYRDRWSFVRRWHNRGVLCDCDLLGVPEERQALGVYFSGQADEKTWLAAADAVENNDYPIAFMIVVEGTVTLPRDMTVPANTLLHVDNQNSSLVIPAGRTLTNDGDIYIWSGMSLVNEGTLINRRGVHIYGDLYNTGTIRLDESLQEQESFFEVDPEGYVENNGQFYVNSGGHLWMMGSWEGNDPIANGGFMLLGRYQGRSNDAVMAAGQSRTLKVYDCITGKTLSDKLVSWKLPQEYAPYAYITSKGKLTARAVTEQITIEAVATVKGYDREVVTRIHLYPAVTQMEILDGETVVNGKTVSVDISETQRSFRLKLYPLDLDTPEMKNGWCSWSISDKKNAYAKYAVEDGVLTVTEPTGKAGTVTVKVTCNVGTKKTVTFKLKFGRFATDVDILNTETRLVSGQKLELVAAVSPRDATNDNVVWKLKNPADKTYVTLSKGVVKANTVYDEHEVTLIALSGDGEASREYKLTVAPRDTGILVLKRDGENVTKRTVYVDLNKADSVTLTAHTFGVEAEAEAVSWKSSDKKIALVSGGTVRFLKKGSVTVTATCAGRTASVTVKATRLASDVIITGSNEVASGKSVTLKAVLEDASSQKVTWSIAKGSAYGKISSKGKFTAAAGITSEQQVIIRATAADGSGKGKDFTVTVRPVAQGIQIYARENGQTAFDLRSDAGWWVSANTTLTWDLRLHGRILDLDADVFPYYEDEEYRKLNAIQTVNWTSSKPKVAAVRKNEDGSWYVECLGPGTATITAKAADGSGKKVSFKLTVRKTIGDLSLEDQQVRGGKSIKLAGLVQVDPADAFNQKFKWKILSGKSYATLSSSGTLKAKKTKKERTVIIQVTATDGSGATDTCTVTILP